MPVIGRRGPQSCETSRLPHFLDNRITDDGEVVSLTRRPPFNPRKIPGTHLVMYVTQYFILLRNVTTFHSVMHLYTILTNL
jgi:hypothetical protein